MKLASLFLSILSLTITSCQYPYYTGTNITDDQIASISNKRFSKAEIEDKFGLPNLVPDYSPDNWYYVYRHSTKRAFFNPVIKEQRVVAMQFSNDKLQSIELIENEHNPNISVVREYIRTEGSQKNPVQEYIGNIGRFHKNSAKKPRR